MSDASADAGSSSGGFERYGLLAAVTLVVLCMILADRYRSAPRMAAAPAPDRLLRVRIGGFDSAANAERLAAIEASRGGRGATPPAPVRVGPQKPPVGGIVPAPIKAPPAPAPAPQAPRTCVIAAGETLGDIAARELGSAKRAREIADLNGITDIGKIRAGQSLRLPPR